jgi:Cu/Ag efflux pump CusA
VLYIAGAKLNLMVLAGLLIALGAIVDDAIVATQNIAQRLSQLRSQGRAEESKSWIIREASVETQSVLLYASAIVLLAIAPAVFTQGMTGAFFQPFAYAYALAVAVSMLVALTITPVLSALLLRDAPVESPIVGALQRAYQAIVSPILASPAPALAVAGLVALAGVVILPKLRQETLLPTFKEMDLMVHLDARPGTSHPAMSRIASQLSRELRSIAGVKNVSAQIGRAITSEEVAEVNSSELLVSVDPAADYDATSAAIRKVVAGFPGFDRDVEGYLSERVAEEMQGEDRGVVVRVYGDDLKILRRKAEEVRKLLAKTNGVANPIVEAPAEQPTLHIEPDLDRCKAHGVKPGDIRRTAAALLSGMEVGSLYEDQKVFEVVVWGRPEVRQSLNSVGDLLIDKPAGGQVPLKDVANVKLVPSPTVIQRQGVARYIDVLGDVRGRDLGAIAGDVQAGLAQIEFPLEYRAELLGATAERLAAQRRVLAFAIAAAIGIYLILQVAFGSWRLATLVFALLPIALVGGVLAVFATGSEVSIGSMIGLAAVLAIAVRNSVVLVRRYQQLAAGPDKATGDPEIAELSSDFETHSPLNGVNAKPADINAELVLRGTRERLLPILLTAVATALAFLPLAIYGDIPGQEIAYPIAIVVLGGLVTSTLVSLYLLPALYLWLKVKPAAEVLVESTAGETPTAPSVA